jgi:hypothetical protein
MRTPITVAACIATGAIAVGAASVSASPPPKDERSGAGLADVRRATAPYHQESRARRDGYVPAGACVELPGEGGMGVHYLNPRLAGDSEVDPRQPELLLYEPRPNGRMRLVGVEWFVADADQDLATDDDRPSLLGRPFDGPMPGHEPGMPVHYDLHAYVWRHNPNGVFAPWNPRVQCP